MSNVKPELEILGLISIFELIVGDQKPNYLGNKSKSSLSLFKEYYPLILLLC
jgi:hypothetical protein